MSGLPRYGIDIGARRVVHVALLVLIVLGVRACGGATQTEDRLNVVTRWMVEKTGMTAAKDAWDAKVLPPVAAVTRSLSDTIYGGVSRALDTAAVAADGLMAWIGQQVTNVEVAIETRIRAILMPKPTIKPVPTNVPAPPQKDGPQSPTP